MDTTDFAIAMVSGVIIIIAIFLFILLKIFGKKKNAKLIKTVLPDIDKIGPNEFPTEQFGKRTQKIEGLEKEFQLAHERQKNVPVIKLMGEKKEDKSSIEHEKKIVPINEKAQNPIEIKEKSLKGSTEPIKEISLSQPGLSIEENEKLKLEDNLIEIRDENTKKKARSKRTSGKNLEKSFMTKEREVPEKNPMRSPVRKKIVKYPVPEQVSKESEERSSRKRPGKKGSTKIITQAIVKENPESGEL